MSSDAPSTTSPLTAPTDVFVDRHIGPRASDQQAMLERIGHTSLDSLMQAAVPESIRATSAPTLPAALGEQAALGTLKALASRNNPGVSMIGLGYHPTVTPAVIRRNVLEDPAWYTAYTPYQPEISQGRLEALLNYQTMVADLTGLTTANASLLDEGTAAAEAMTLVRRAARGKDLRPLVLDTRLLPQTLAVVRTRAEALGIELLDVDLGTDDVPADVAGAIVAYPAADGAVTDPSRATRRLHGRA